MLPILHLLALVVFLYGCGCNGDAGTQVEGLLDALLRTRSRDAREQLRLKIRSHGDAAVEPVYRAACSNDEDLSAAAQWVSIALPPLSRRSYTNRLAAVLHDPSQSEETRTRAAVALGYESRFGVEHLLTALDSHDAQTRISASWGIYCTREKGELETNGLRRALRDDVPRVRQYVVEAVTGETALVEVLLPDLILVLDDPAPDVRLAALNVLIAAGEASLPHITKAVHDQSLKNSFRLAPVFSALGSSGISALSALLKNPDKATIVSALGILQTIGPSARDALPAIRELENAPDQELRWFAAAAAAQLVE